MISLAERRFPVRIRIAVPPNGLGQRYAQITGSLDENCGADGWAIMLSGTRGVLNDALSIDFADAMPRECVRGAMVHRAKIETAGGMSKCLRMSPNRGLGRGCIGRR
jgi:hypothetical protein